MSVEANKELVRAYLQLYDEHRFDLIGQYLADDFVVHGSDLDLGREAVVQANTAALAAFPDTRFCVEDVIAEGDKVVARVTITGTHLGELATTPGARPVPATGRPVMMSLILIARVEDGKIVEGWRVEDDLSMMRQLGLIPEPQLG